MHRLRYPLGIALATLFALIALACNSQTNARGIALGSENSDERQSSGLLEERDEPLSPEQALREFEIVEGFEIELAAAEPLVVDPVAIEFDAAGRMWVVEMRDYPTPPKPDASGQPTFNGAIKILSDQDQDGRFDSATVFADNLVFPTGLQLFQNGAIVTVAGQVVFMEDVDGDDQCDRVTNWFKGFSEGNEQLRANHPTLTIENRIHIASGLRGGDIVCVHPEWATSKESVWLGQRDFEFDPFNGNWRAVAGNSQFGFYQDEQARDYVCSNRNPCELLMAEAEQVTNPLQPLVQWQISVMPAAEESQVFPLVDAWTTSNLHAGQFTAACGVYRYESDLLNDLLQNSYFACEPTGSLVQRYATLNDGLVPEVVRGEANREFLASRDSWFRPVYLTDGPDGSIYVVDMHRAVIEHPDWMPEELKTRADMRWGSQAGRIYRITPTSGGSSSQSKPLDLSTASNEELVANLASANRWRRRTSQRLLLEKLHAEDERETRESIVERLTNELRDGTDSSSEFQEDSDNAIRAMWLLSSANELTTSLLETKAKSDNEFVRRQVVVLLANNPEDSATWKQTKLLLSQDESAAVRYQWLLEFGTKAKAEELEQVFAAARPRESDTDAERVWLSSAVACLADQCTDGLIERMLKQNPTSVEFVEPLLRRAGRDLNLDALMVVLESDVEESKRDQVWNAFSNGLLSSGKGWQSIVVFSSPKQVKLIEERIASDRETVEDASINAQARLAAFERLRNDRSEQTLQLSRSVIDSRDGLFWNSALEVLRLMGNEDDGNVLVKSLQELPPQNFAATLKVLLENRKWTSSLVEALEGESIPAGLIDANSWQRLRRHPDQSVAKRVNELYEKRFTVAEKGSALWEKYRVALEVTPDLKAGESLFQKNCAVCHRIGEYGSAVGPDISDLRTTSPEQVLTAILDPNGAIDAAYFRYVLLTTEGQVFEGLLEEGQGDSVTLLMQDGKRITIDRDGVEMLKATGVSLMPAGMEQQLSPKEMADLVGYVKGWRYLETKIPSGDGR